MLKGAAVGAALGGSDPASRTAKGVLKARFNEFSGLLKLAADTYRDTDQEAAANLLAVVADLNSGDPHVGK
ncbi:conserved hypothetical protein [Nocardia seriolae]|nr:conserved hypothetical protein [Nocardia seriolae]